MELHRFTETLSLVSHGPVDLAGAIHELRSAAGRASRNYDRGEDSIAQTSFVLARDTRDFLEVNCDASDDIWFQSDRLVPPSSLLARLFSRKRTLALRCSLAGAERVIQHYIERDRRDFESLYSLGYTSGTSRQVRVEPPAA